jgi:hypothetical protein
MHPTRRLITNSHHNDLRVGTPSCRCSQGQTEPSQRRHVPEKRGPHTVSAEVKDGKIPSMHVKHCKEGERKGSWPRPKT